jgi:hypothetical protein
MRRVGGWLPKAFCPAYALDARGCDRVQRVYMR